MYHPVPNIVNEIFKEIEKKRNIVHFPLAFGVICQTGGLNNKCIILVTKNLIIMRNYKSQDYNSCSKEKGLWSYPSTFIQ